MRRLPPNLHSYEHGGLPAPRAALVAPAKILLPFLRWPLGYETAHPKSVFVRLAVLCFIPPVFWFLMGLLTGSPPPPREGREAIDMLIAASFIMTCLRFVRRAWGQHRGEEIHTAEAGYSFVARWLPLPVALSEQLIVPALLIWLGWKALLTVSVDLGLWLAISGLSYFVLSNWEHRNKLAQRRAPVDDKIRAQTFGDNVDQHEQKLIRSKGHRKGKAAPLYAANQQPDIAELGGGRRNRG